MKTTMIEVREVVKRECKENPEYLDLLADPEKDFDYKEKMKNAMLISDSCSTALKGKRIFSSRLGGTNIQLDCFNHMGCIFLGESIAKALSSHITVILHDSLSEIDPKLRVNAPMVNFARAIDKEFSAGANYPKGDWELYHGWMRTYHSGAVLFPVESMHGSRQYVMFSAAIGIWCNQEYFLEFLDFVLKIPGKQNNILRQNLFCLLSSVEIMAQVRLLGMFHLAFVMPMRYLAGTTHLHKKYGWGVFHMSKVVTM